ncbi:MAG TPA: L-histidine N(alpha)-methyltransferase [Rhodocyclaceae bacterium]|nr:L-histidine N(alpha)-methyltransferase [Rhodocyclaceae bacterium]HRQ46797.1 L-histidine N(alpha)-methyltransferase [Rhodocyclaceae bacterium]
MSAREPQIVGRTMGQSEFALDLLACFEAHPHSISPKYFYDCVGSQLFERICDLPEYYLTRTEISIFDRHVAEMAAAIGPGAEVVEFGAGSLRKARLLLDALPAPRRFIAIDISGEHLEASATELRSLFPSVEIEPVVGDFTRLQALSLWGTVGKRRIGFFPGSTIGNFTLEQAHEFLSAAASLLAGGGLLIGVDLVKDPRVLHAAYNDAAGVTASFNRNLLTRANRELGCDFHEESFHHYAFYQAQKQRIEMHLISTCVQEVSLCDRRFVLAEGESIHTESSQKYTIEGFHALARQCGFRPRTTWCDDRRLFSVHWLEAPS